MSKTYEALNLVREQTEPSLNFNPQARGTSSFAALLAEEFAQIERVVGGSLGKLKTAVDERAHMASTEKAQLEQHITKLIAAIAALESKLTEAETVSRTKEAALQAEVSRLKDGISEMAAAFAKQAKQLTADHPSPDDTVQMTVSLNGLKAKPTYSQAIEPSDPGLLER